MTHNEGFNIVKKHQRKVNQIIKRINKQMIDDNEFLGCFSVKQINKRISKEDGLTYIMYEFLFEFHNNPKKNKIVYLNRWDAYSETGSYLYYEMNKFIVDHCKYWEWRRQKYETN